MEQEQDTAVDTYPLDDAAIELLTEIGQQQAALTASMNGALSLFAKQHKLQGQWQLSSNGKELVKAT